MPKIIGKLLALHLQNVIDSIIGLLQLAFIKGRNIFDGHIITKKLQTWIQRSGRQMLLLKIDFAKAFDSVNLQYLLDIMEKMGFGTK